MGPLASAKEVQVDDVIAVRPGEAILVDGLVVAGCSSVDQVMITSKSLPIEKLVGNEVIAGRMNKTGVCRFKEMCFGRETAVTKIIELVEEAQATNALIQRIAD